MTPLRNPRFILIIVCAVTALIVMMKFTSDSMSSSSLATYNYYYETTGASSNPNSADQQQQQQQLHHSGVSSSSQINYNIIFSTFYFRQNFYTGRKVPSLDWVLVMIESAYEHRKCKSCSSSSSSSSSTTTTYQDTKLVFFADSDTKTRLEKTISERASSSSQFKARPDFIKEKFLEIVLVNPNADDDPELARLISTQKWADSKQLKNAANNFRFWLMQRYLKRMLPSDVVQEENNINDADQGNDDSAVMTKTAIINPQLFESLSKIRIAIVDASDVYFQANPFEQGTCFPSTTTKNNNKKKTKKEEEHFFLFTLEDASKNFKNEVYNKRWMKCYDEVSSSSSSSNAKHRNSNVNNHHHHQLSPVAEMAKKYMRISCAGVSLGSYFGVLVYLNAQLAEISRPELAECAVSKIKAALDQATHNFLMFMSAWGVKHEILSRLGITNSWMKALKQESSMLNRDLSPVLVAAVPHSQHRSGTNWRFMKNMIWETKKNNNNNKSSDNDNVVEAVTINWKENSDCVFHGNFAKLKMNDREEVVAYSSSSSSSVYPIVHQYTSDRHPRVMTVAKEKYDV